MLRLLKPRTAPTVHRTCSMPGCGADGVNTYTFTQCDDLDLYITFPSDGPEHTAHAGKPLCVTCTEEAIMAFEMLALTDGGPGYAVHTTPSGTVHTTWANGVLERL